MRNMLHRGYFTIVKSSHVWGQDANIYIESPEQFDKLYEHKILGYYRRFSIGTENDFLNEQIELCEGLINECLECKRTPFGQSGRAFSDLDMDYEILLIKKWREYLNKVKEDIPKIINPSVFIAELNLKQPVLHIEEVKSIKSAIKHVVYSNMSYFKLEHGEERNWDYALYYIYEKITDYYYEIGNTKDRSGINLLYDSLVSHKERLRISLEFFNSVFEYLILENKIADCLRLLNVFRKVMTLYNEVLNQSTYNFKESYFYSTINDYYKHILSEYNSEKLNLRTSISMHHEDKVKANTITSVDYLLKKNNFNYLSVTDVSKHFQTNLKNHCDTEVIKKFLHSAFEECKPPKKKYRFLQKTNNKRKIMKVFFNFYHLSGKPAGEASKYAKLLADYFDGYEVNNVKTNWNKAV